MDHAVHARRGFGARNMASTLRKVLDGFHSKKKERGVDEMLTSLYEPILWRSIKAANADVRTNATALFFCAFPLQRPTTG